MWEAKHFGSERFGVGHRHMYSNNLIENSRNFLDSPGVKNVPCNSGRTGLIPGQGTKLTGCKERSCVLQLRPNTAKWINICIFKEFWCPLTFENHTAELKFLPLRLISFPSLFFSVNLYLWGIRRKMDVEWNSWSSWISCLKSLVFGLNKETYTLHRIGREVYC